MRLVTIGILIAGWSAISFAQEAAGFGQAVVNRTTTNESKIKVETIVPQAVVLRNVTGDYSQHVKFFTDMMAYVPKYIASLGNTPNIRTAGIGAGGACSGIYPDDPDVVDPASLKWQVAMSVTAPLAAAAGAQPDIRAMSDKVQSAMKILNAKKPAAPYRAMMLPSTEAVTLMSDVKNAAFDGNSMYRWMLEHGYVQTSPTRMEYLAHSGDPHDIEVKIIIPAVKRKSGLTLPPERQ